MNRWLGVGETWDDLLRQGLGVIQPANGYRFAMDSVLLAHFAACCPATDILDLGTGCGVVAILLAARRPEARVTGLEIQPDQADRARRSVLANRMQERVEVLEGDLRQLDTFPAASFDLITINPPFWPAGRGKLPENPEVAVSCHEIMCTQEDILAATTRWLKPRGRFCMIIPASRLQETLANTAGHHLWLSRLRLVHPGKEQEANLVLLEFRKRRAAREPLLLPPLVVYAENGEYSSEIMSIYYD